MNGVVWLGLGGRGGKYHNVTSIEKCLKEASETLYLQRQNSKLVHSIPKNKLGQSYVEHTSRLGVREGLGKGVRLG